MKKGEEGDLCRVPGIRGKNRRRVPRVWFQKIEKMPMG
jgi:hypothetical protein